MEKFGKGFPFEENIGGGDGLGVAPEKGLQSGRDPNDFAPGMPPKNNLDDYLQQKAKMKAMKAKIEAGKKPAVPKVELYDRGNQLNDCVDIIASKMSDRGLPVLVGGIGAEGSEGYRFVGGRIDMEEYIDIPGITRKIVKDDMAEVQSITEEKQEEIERNAKINARRDALSDALGYQEKIRQTEILSFLLLQKKLKDQIPLFMSSEYDKSIGGAQMFCLDDQGNPLAVINAVLDDSPRRLAIRHQQNRALDVNTGRGLKVKYGLAADADEKDNNKKITEDTIFNLPLFNIVFNGRELEILGNLFDSDKELTNAEKAKINYIAADFYLQIDDLQDKTKDDSVEEKIKAFEAELRKIISRDDVATAYEELKKQREKQQHLARSVKPKKKNPWGYNKKPITS